MTIRADGVAVRFTKKGRQPFTAVQPTDITIESGKLTVITGRSGSGKTTLINVLSGLLPPNDGSLSYDKTDIYSLDDEHLSEFRNRHIGYIPQGQSAVSSLTVLQNIILPMALRGEKADSERAHLLLETAGLSAHENAYPDKLSGGELRRLAVVRALINSPGIIFADEPTNDLDDENTEAILSLLKEQTKKGSAAVIVTHEQSALKYADITYRMVGGRLHNE